MIASVLIRYESARGLAMLSKLPGDSDSPPEIGSRDASYSFPSSLPLSVGGHAPSTLMTKVKCQYYHIISKFRFHNH